ncbi:hypothetical protein LZ554_001468 [Drepanopeziza brunnea f. sp. 'monogermtubi']|nr:hypothetical protein LZ554_001468 [Drepanopeziza brunnea f. sp. 'monogermtubi']
MVPGSFTESPVQSSVPGALNGFEESPFIDYDYEFEGDGSFDYSEFNNGSKGQMFGNLPGSSSDGGENDTHDKRSHPEDEGDEEDGGGKRREGDEKTSKKPGRKPLTSEPTSKRKAQNRAAQRAFRERKEKHLKDLETKVEDLEKASESANHENSILRAQIEKMSMELREYRRRPSLNGAPQRAPSLGNGLPPYLAKGFANGGLNNPSDVNFQFEFPRFGRLPGPSAISNVNGTRISEPPPVTGNQTVHPHEKDQVSPRNQSLQYPASNGPGAGLTQTPTQLDGGDMSSLSGLFSPTLLESVTNTSSFEYLTNNNNGSNGSRSSADSASGNMSTGHNTSYSSPSVSSNSNHEPSSSCGTSPEPAMQSPVYNKPLDSSLTTIGEENTVSGEGMPTFCDKLNMACGDSQNPIPRLLSEPIAVSETFNPPPFDFNGIDWFAQQNNNQFDPQLFGDYRESQDNILQNEAFGDSFFTDSFALGDFASPFNMAPSPAPSKKGLVDQIDMEQNKEEAEEVVPGEDRAQMLNCNTIWDRLQACPKVKEGDFDLDSLCKDLQKKARCSETGAVLNESDFNKIMKSYVEQPKKTTQA